MTANDKTGQKLVDSMRKTKAAAADKAGAQNSRGPAPAKKAARPQAKKKAAARRSPNILPNAAASSPARTTFSAFIPAGTGRMNCTRRTPRTTPNKTGQDNAHTR